MRTGRYAEYWLYRCGLRSGNRSRFCRTSLGILMFLQSSSHTVCRASHLPAAGTGFFSSGRSHRTKRVHNELM